MSSTCPDPVHFMNMLVQMVLAHSFSCIDAIRQLRPLEALLMLQTWRTKPLGAHTSTPANQTSCQRTSCAQRLSLRTLSSTSRPLSPRWRRLVVPCAPAAS